jgi:hypothetical protein
MRQIAWAGFGKPYEQLMDKSGEQQQNMKIPQEIYLFFRITRSCYFTRISVYP